MRARQATRRTEHQSNDWSPAFSPDGLKIVHRSERDGGGLYMIDALGDGGAELKVAAGGQLPRFSPDGKTIAYVVPEALVLRARLFVVAAGGGVPRPFQPGFVVIGSAVVFQAPVWSPDGESILFYGVRVGGREAAGWWIAPLGSGEPVRVEGMPTPAPGAVNVVFGWRGDSLYCTEGEPINGSTIYRIRLERDPWRIGAPPEKLLARPGVQSAISISAEGLMVFDALARLTDVWSAPLDRNGVAAGPLEQLTGDSTGKRHLTVASNGSRLAYVAYGPPGQRNVEVRVRELPAGRESLIAGSGNYPFLDPILSRDGSKIGYSDVPENKRVGYVAETSGPGGRSVCEDCLVEGFSADAKEILVSIGGRLLRQRLNSGRQEPIAELDRAGSHHCLRHADGRWTAECRTVRARRWVPGSSRRSFATATSRWTHCAHSCDAVLGQFSLLPPATTWFSRRRTGCHAVNGPR